MMHDPIGLGESAVIIACLVFYAWWFSPAQRAKRRRDQAHDRAQLRRAFADATDPARAPVTIPSTPRHRPGRPGVKDTDARLLRRLSDANAAIASVLLLLIERWNNDADGGLRPAADLRSLGQDLVELGRDMIAHADEVDRITTEPPLGDHESDATNDNRSAGDDQQDR
jgi:hypothetical protein